MQTRLGKAYSRFLSKIGGRLAVKLHMRSSGYQPYTPSDYQTLCQTLLPGDVLLIEGNERISNAIKYLTQSTWSHAAIFVGDVLPELQTGEERPRLVEVNLGEGCVAAPLSKYETYNTRICRAKNLTDEDRAMVVDFMVGKLGLRYDLRHIFDLLRYFFPTPPVPVRWRRRMLAFGSGDPTRAICSSLIAQAFQSVRYPILPDVKIKGPEGDFARQEIYQIRHHSLFTPRDFDLSPYFEVVKPTLVQGFDYKKLVWTSPTAASLEK
ncbi:YiiX/YebB-like N1pC/P60 family cysteine hydrolase [Pseudohalocynthiibacter aestuariivivens]|jgi:Permuted papain-like amidase enzyme, YaeF/YiiX, C92 family|uniref:YiiX/YebB-like N1pC/P60 family cysteine hydrolase n=1 Tax=Pseudohalocynthiibacter aestuariivivens TaxID=1591409 RepID=A0ABV5J9X7_9RHOB|nr:MULTISPECIES: YiiX/YebB-like N1pC/P60 family cysteine hydrolase [Pseudohalocynthiibacter]MBS9716829.1 lipo-like protein [Pseudohalocynthiibacter aestuariivivens]MCK0102078.1 lipo-like protein [Pseudohalocynthiibacter sp. F2068]